MPPSRAAGMVMSATPAALTRPGTGSWIERTRLDPLPRLQLGEQLLPPDRRDHAPTAALVARLGSEGQAARNRPPAFAGWARVKVVVNFIGHRLEFRDRRPDIGSSHPTHNDLSCRHFLLDARQPRGHANRPDAPRPTLAEMRQAAPWLWVWCRNVHCRRKAPMALAPLTLRQQGRRPAASKRPLKRHHAGVSRTSGRLAGVKRSA
jgi:hypothetical protein